MGWMPRCSFYQQIPHQKKMILFTHGIDSLTTDHQSLSLLAQNESKAFCGIRNSGHPTFLTHCVRDVEANVKLSSEICMTHNDEMSANGCSFGFLKETEQASNKN